MFSAFPARAPISPLTQFGEVDSYLFSNGVHYELYNRLGSHLCQQEGIRGTYFTVWAPRAQRVSVIGDFNQWKGERHPMQKVGDCGVWELFIPGIGQGEKYKFEIVTREGFVRHKADPFANFQEMRPCTASIVFDVNTYAWNDAAWRERERGRDLSRPMNVYEVHLGSWKKHDWQWLNYKELAHELARYCQEMGFSHVELLPIMEHPLDESWGYQVTGFFAATSRYGTPADFQYFVDYLHQKGIGVILDWVPAHFPTDDYSLAQFDGDYLYEYTDPKKGFHPHWNTHIFDYGRPEIRNFLIASALFWLDKMHIDALRVDAVASMLYLDYGRSHGEWIPNIHGGKENLEAIEFIKHLNSIVHEKYPHVLMIAEESTAFDGVSRPLEWGGLGFDMKWNMGWMNDTLRYFHTDCLYRTHHQSLLTFGLVYAFSERFLLPLSHDEVVHEKGSLLAKMPGDLWQKMANLRLLYSYQICQPGKKLLFMGAELGQWTEWNCRETLPWHLLQYVPHRQLYHFFKVVNHFYHRTPALWEIDFESQGFTWVDSNDHKNSVLSYLRKGFRQSILCVHNFTPTFHPNYFLRLSSVTTIHEIFNTDHEAFGGSGQCAHPVRYVEDSEDRRIGIEISIAPLATLIFEVRFNESD